MKKYIIITLCLFFGLSSCKYELDRTDIMQVSDALNKSLMENDTSLFNIVFYQPLDSMENYIYNSTIEIFDFFKNEVELIKRDTINRRIEIGSVNLTTGKRDPDYSRTEIIKELKFYYLHDNDFYQLTADYSDKFGYNSDDISIKKIRLDNISENCETHLNSPYRPSYYDHPIYGIDFKSITWQTDLNKTLFKSGTVMLQNNTEEDWDYIKFRVTLKHGSNRRSAETIFNQTIESDQKFYDGDLISINIPQMSNYYPGVRIEDDYIHFDAELIELRPKPESQSCRTLAELKEFLGNN